MVRLKVLPLQKWMYKDEGDTPVEPMFHRDGIYLMVDGPERKAWFECNGSAYSCRGLEADVLLAVERHTTPLLRASELEALELLHKQHLLKRGDRLYKWLEVNRANAFLRKIRRGR